MRSYHLNYPLCNCQRTECLGEYKIRPYKIIGGGERVRTDDPLRARQVLSQLSYTPDKTVISFEFLVFSFKCF